MPHVDAMNTSKSTNTIRPNILASYRLFRRQLLVHVEEARDDLGLGEVGRPAVGLQDRLVNQIARCPHGTFTGLKVSFHGSPCFLSAAMNGSGSNSSQVWTPLVVHLPSRNIFAPIIAGTPVV